MPSILNMKHPSLKALKKSMPELQGKMLARGSFTVVYPRTDDTVWKLTIDPHNYNLAVSDLHLRSNNFTHLEEDRGVVGTVEGLPIYLVGVEKLRCHDNHPTVRRIIKSFCKRYEVLGLLDQPRPPAVEYDGIIKGMLSDSEMPHEIHESLIILSDYIANLDTSLDLGNSSNFMLNRFDDIVFSDPVYCEDMIEEYQNRLNPDAELLCSW